MRVEEELEGMKKRVKEMEKGQVEVRRRHTEEVANKDKEIKLLRSKLKGLEGRMQEQKKVLSVEMEMVHAERAKEWEEKEEGYRRSIEELEARV